MVLARLVTPQAFGLFAVALGLSSLLSAASRDSVVSWIARSDEIGDPGLRTPFLLSAAGAAVSTLILLLLAGPITHAVGAPDAAGPLRLLCLVFVLLPFDAAFGGLMRRRMRFDLVAIAGITAVFVGGVVSIGLALWGWEERALALGAVGEAIALAIMSFYLARDGRPLLRRAGAPVGEVALFCARVTGANVLSSLGKLTATLATARFLGPQATGLYDRARRVTWTFGDLVLNAISPVVLPSLAEVRRERGDLGTPYLFKLQALTLVAWPFFAGLAIASEPVVLLLLGEDWIAAVPLIQAACLFGLPLPYHTTDTAFLLAAGRERTHLRIQGLTQVITLVLVIVAAQSSVAAVFVAYAAARLAKSVMTTAVLTRSFGMSVATALRAGGHSALVAGGVALTAWGCITALGSPQDWFDAAIALILTGSACACTFVALIVSTDHPVRAEAAAALSHLTSRLKFDQAG